MSRSIISLQKRYTISFYFDEIINRSMGAGLPDALSSSSDDSIARIRPQLSGAQEILPPTTPVPSAPRQPRPEDTQSTPRQIRSVRTLSSDEQTSSSSSGSQRSNRRRSFELHSPVRIPIVEESDDVEASTDGADVSADYVASREADADQVSWTKVCAHVAVPQLEF